MGANWSFKRMIVDFSIEEVEKLRKMDSKGEF
jgi:hypothetical protein